jgi:nucleotide-binding universal stress UspA family protein
MQAKHLLVPVDLDKPGDSFDALRFVEGLAGSLALEVTLLHVVPLNIVWGERRVYDELRAESETRLRALARRFFKNPLTLNFHIRLGRPHEEILAEAASTAAELILLSSPKVGRWKLLFGSRTAERVVRAAPCLTLVLPGAWRIVPEQYRQAMRGHDSIPPANRWQPDFSWAHS